MRIIKALGELEDRLSYLVLTIGNFDGPHLGHQQILKTIIERASQRSGTAAVMTFDPHPQRILAPERAPRQIQTLEQKIATLAGFGIDLLIILPFTLELAGCSAREFVVQILSDRLNVKELYVGSNFMFGKGREGNVALLEKIGAEKGFKVGRVDEVYFRNLKISSTVIRQLLVAGRVSLAKRLLNRCYSLVGTVVSGRGLGTRLGFPTVNTQPENEIVPKFGVYVTYFYTDGQRYRSVTNIGVRPTFAGSEPSEPTIETFVFDLDRELYGKRVALDFCFRLRDEIKFPSQGALIEQIQRDVRLADRYFDFVESVDYGDKQ